MCIVLKSYIICLDILSDQSQNCSDNLQFWSENVRCPTTISSTALSKPYGHLIVTLF